MSRYQMFKWSPTRSVFTIIDMVTYVKQFPKPYSIQPTTNVRQYIAIQLGVYNMHPTSYSIQPEAGSVQYNFISIEHSTYHLQHTPHKLHHRTCNIEQA